MSPLAQARSRTATAARGAFGRAAAAARGGTVRLRERARRETRRRRLLWLAVAVLLTLGPALFTLARASEFTAGVQLFPAAAPPFPAHRDPAVYSSYLTDPILQREMQRNAGARPSEYLDASIRREGPRRSLRIAVSASDRERARVLANALARQLLVAEQRRIAGRAGGLSLALTQRLDSRRVRPAARRRLERRLALVRRLVPLPPNAGGVVGPPAAEPPLTRSADRLVDALPGAFPARQSPLAAAAAGLLIALTLWLLALWLAPPRER